MMNGALFATNILEFRNPSAPHFPLELQALQSRLMVSVGPWDSLSIWSPSSEWSIGSPAACWSLLRTFTNLQRGRSSSQYEAKL